VGRLDGRVKAVDSDPTGNSATFEPSEAAIGGAFTAAAAMYIRGELGYHSDLEYRATIHGLDRRWDWHHKPPGQDHRLTTPDVALDLAAAMLRNPRLRVLSLNGYFDLVTPFFATEFDLDHMLLPPDLRNNIRFAYYPAGHMAYLNPDAQKQMHDDLVQFYAAALK
jgi:carboxypeptidase C (cathepsin A)